MLEYARWKYVLVGVVLLLALILALPNVFGDDPALQVARKDHSPVAADAIPSVEGFLKERQISFEKGYIDSGRLMIRFPNVTEQLKARDAVNDRFKADYVT